MTCSLQAHRETSRGQPIPPGVLLRRRHQEGLRSELSVQAARGYDVLQRLPVAGSVLRFFVILVLEVMPMVQDLCWIEAPIPSSWSACCVERVAKSGQCTESVGDR